MRRSKVSKKKEHVRKFLGTERKTYRFTETSSNLPYFYYGYGGPRPDLQEMFHSLAEMLSEPSSKETEFCIDRNVASIRTAEEIPPIIFGDNSSTTTDRQCLIEIQPELADLLTKIYSTVQEALGKQYDAGKQAGRQLLVQLARGEVLLSDFEEKFK